VRQLGRPASHGCVRLHPDNARIFFSLVREVGQQNTLISIVQ
jgi:lipoprotein-anchoring transpeptidase ErfK/SrfK